MFKYLTSIRHCKNQRLFTSTKNQDNIVHKRKTDLISEMLMGNNHDQSQITFKVELFGICNLLGVAISFVSTLNS